MTRSRPVGPQTETYFSLDGLSGIFQGGPAGVRGTWCPRLFNGRLPGPQVTLVTLVTLITLITLVTLVILLTLVTLVTLITLVILVTLVTLVPLVTLVTLPGPQDPSP